MHMSKERVCITIEPELIDKAKEYKINVSNVAEAALMRELDLYTRNSYTKAIERQNDVLKKFLSDNALWEKFEEFKYQIIS